MPADSLLRWCARTYWRWLVVGVLAAIGWRACMFAIAFAVGQAVDQGLERDNHTATAWWASVALGTAGLLALFDATRHWCADIGYYEVLADVRRRLYSHVQSLDPRWHATTALARCSATSTPMRRRSRCCSGLGPSLSRRS